MADKLGACVTCHCTTSGLISPWWWQMCPACPYRFPCAAVTGKVIHSGISEPRGHSLAGIEGQSRGGLYWVTDVSNFARVSKTEGKGTIHSESLRRETVLGHPA
ncbi:uncharacterized [Tachysurus ichikawai]